MTYSLIWSVIKIYFIKQQMGQWAHGLEFHWPYPPPRSSWLNTIVEWPSEKSITTPHLKRMVFLQDVVHVLKS